MKQLALLTLIAASAGVAAALVTLRIVAKPAAPAMTSAAAVIAPAGGESARIEEVEREVRLLVQQQPSQDARPEPRADPPPTPEQERDNLERVFGGYEQRFSGERLDPDWAEPLARHLHDGLQSIADEDGFEIVAATCRTTQCRATLRWTSYDDALATQGDTLPMRIGNPDTLPCGKSIWLREPRDPGALYTAELYMDCAAQRAAGRFEPGHQEERP